MKTNKLDGSTDGVEPSHRGSEVGGQRRVPCTTANIYGRRRPLTSASGNVNKCKGATLQRA